VCCSASTSSVQWWITHVQSGGTISKYFRIATNTPWYVRKRQIHEDLCSTSQHELRFFNQG
jgi:hypothetical protein